MTEFPLLTLLTFLPLIGALFIITIRGDEAQVAQNSKYVALFTSGLFVFPLSLFLLFQFDPNNDGFQFVDIEDLNADLVNEKEPDIILSPLVGDDFDAVDVAIKLIELKFKGRYRAISDEMPDAELIRKEVRAFAPQLDFDLLLMPRMEAGE